MNKNKYNFMNTCASQLREKGLMKCLFCLAESETFVKYLESVETGKVRFLSSMLYAICLEVERNS